MADQSFGVYAQEVIRLSRSLVIKVEEEIRQNHWYLRSAGKLIEEDPKQWRYYLNLNGEYHQSNVPMQVISLDTRETINLTKEELRRHPNTLLDLQPGRDTYREVLTRYPAQYVLIRGIVNPIPPEVSIPAKDGTILYWDKSLVEPQETNLIPMLQHYIYQVMRRWFIDTHATNNGLALSGFLINLAKGIVDAIHVIRQESTHSNQAHSYHVWAYLASNHQLDRYRRFLTNEQALWLYREIKQLKQTAGSKANLNELIENLLTPLGIRAYELVFKQDTQALPELDYSVERHPLNFKGSDLLDLLRITVRDVNERLAYGLNRPIEAPIIDTENNYEQLAGLTTTQYPTKVIETLVPQTVDLFNDTEVNHLLRQWGYHALQGRYLATIEIKERRSGATLRLSARDAYLLYLRMMMIIDRNVTYDLSTFGITKVISVHQPDVEQLKTQFPLIPETRLLTLLRGTETPPVFRSIDAFFTFSLSQLKALSHFDLLAQQEQHALRKAEHRSVIHHLRRNVHMDLDPEIGGGAWLSGISPSLSSYRPDEALELMVDLLIECTGVSQLAGFNKNRVRDMLVRLINELSTYHVSFINNTADETPINARMEVPRIISFNSLTIKRIYRIPNIHHYRARQHHERKRIIIPDHIYRTLVRGNHQGKASIPAIQLDNVTTNNPVTIRAFLDTPTYRLIEQPDNN